MPRFASMLADGMQKRGHKVHVCYPKPYFFKIPLSAGFKKWLGYIDQYAIFPLQLQKKLRRNKQALLVFTDQALGPWVPLAKRRPHVIHCHDFLAQRSALGEIAENPTGFSGKLYQSYIRKGYKQGENFIAVSEKTRSDLHRFLDRKPAISEVVYNGLNQNFEPRNKAIAKKELCKKTGIPLDKGFLLHVGGNQWYKNRAGVVGLYSEWRKISNQTLPLLLIGLPPNQVIKDAVAQSPYKEDIHFISSAKDDIIRTAYAGASLLIFPSLAEGFGWPIAEAMASGCPVLTTAEAPMKEVAGQAGFLLRRMPAGIEEKKAWLQEGATLIEQVVTFTDDELKNVINTGIENAQRFNTEKAVDKIEAIYKTVLKNYLMQTKPTEDERN
ncbi:MAG: glycosyltransferase [Chitinophagaceae bacterium]|nr:MAG: glycosyltransferase [Chitinophagaceae bacterium]